MEFEEEIKRMEEDMARSVSEMEINPNLVPFKYRTPWRRPWP